jgi:hypothetical protein
MEAKKMLSLCPPVPILNGKEAALLSFCHAIVYVGKTDASIALRSHTRNLALMLRKIFPYTKKNLLHSYAAKFRRFCPFCTLIYIEA